MGTDTDNKVYIYTSDGTEIVKLDFVDTVFEGKSCGDNDILSISPDEGCFSFQTCVHPYFLVKYLGAKLHIWQYVYLLFIYYIDKIKRRIKP